MGKDVHGKGYICIPCSFWLEVPTVITLSEVVSVCHNIVDQLLTEEVSIVSETEKLETE